MQTKYSRVKLGELLRYRSDFFRIDDFSIYKRVTAKLHAQGIVHRDEIKGFEIKTKNQQRCKAGDFLVAEIDAKVGGYGIVPFDLDGAIVSSHYYLYEIDENKLNRQYLHYYIKICDFQDQISAKGSTNYAAIRPIDILDVEIPLPSLDEQKRIVATLDHIMERIEKARQHRAAVNSDLLWDSVLYWTFKPLFANEVKSGESALELLTKQAEKYRYFDIATFNGACPHKPNIYSQGLYDIPAGWVWTDLGSVLTHFVDCVNDTPDFSDLPTDYLGLKSTNVKPYKLDLTEKWYMKNEDFAIWNRRETPQVGDLILTREAPMGNVCILPEGFKVCLTQRLMMLRTDNQFVSNRYLLHYLNSPHFKRQVVDVCRGLTTPHVRVKDAPLIKVPIAPLKVQQQIVMHLDALQSKLNELHMIQSETEKDLEALIPSLLQKAFAGEL